jgi:hypothetical protein
MKESIHYDVEFNAIRLSNCIKSAKSLNTATNLTRWQRRCLYRTMKNIKRLEFVVLKQLVEDSQLYSVQKQHLYDTKKRTFEASK